MSSSLRDQLLKAGLVSEQQVKQAEKQQRKQPRTRKPPPASTQQQRAAQAQAAKAARDRELNRRNAEKAEAKARAAQVRQLVEQHRLPSCEDGEPYHFQDGKHIKRIYVDAEQRAKLVNGELAIARYGNGFALLPLAAAERVRERDPQAVVDVGAGAEPGSTDAEDPYKGFDVPDDLVW